MNTIYHIGIDPGTHTGIAIWNDQTRQLELVATMTILEAMDIIETKRTFLFMPEPNTYSIRLYVENPNTWRRFGKTDQSHRAQGAGSVKRDFAIWKEFAAKYDIELIEIKLQGTAKKVDAAWFKRTTGYKGRTNEHGRDAAMMVWGR